MVELLKQGQYNPLDVIDQIMVIFAGTRGFLDKVPVERVQEWERKFLTFMKDQKPEVVEALRKSLDLNETVDGGLRSALAEFEKQYNFVPAEEDATAAA